MPATRFLRLSCCLPGSSWIPLTPFDALLWTQHGFTGVDERKGDRTWTRNRNLCIRRRDVQGELNHQAPIIHAPFTAESGQVDEKTDESTVKVQTEGSARYDRCGNGLTEAGAKAVKDKCVLWHQARRQPCPDAPLRARLRIDAIALCAPS